MASNLYGKDCKVYTVPSSIISTDYPSVDDIKNTVIPNSTYAFDFNFAMPIIGDNTSRPGDSFFLYDKPTAPTLPSTLNTENVAKLDAWAPNWQLMSLFYSISDGYTGKVNTTECLSLFSNKKDVTSYVMDSTCRALLLLFDNDKFAIYFPCPNSDDWIKNNSFYDLIGNQKSSFNYPFIQFRNGTGCATAMMVKSQQSPSNLAVNKYNTSGSATSNMGDSVYYGNGSIQNLDDDFIRYLDEDFTPPVPTDDEDPYDPGGETGPGGGEGDFDGTTEDIDFPDDPTLSAVDTGFLTLFNPSLSQLNDLANYMWGSIFDIENWKKLFANPMDAILGLAMVPVSVPNGGTGTVKVGNIDTGVSMTKAASQYVNVDCGSLNVREYWGAYLDYSPYTKAEIFLPFIGTHMLNIDDIMGKNVHVKYKVDILSGACVANIKCGGSVLYSYSGQCAATIPITGRDWTQTITAALSVAGNVISVAASQGMTAPMAATNIAQSAVNAIKPNIQKTGNIGGMAGIMGIQKPYIILTRPRQAVPKNQNKYTGYPSFITAKLSRCDGYTEVEKIHLDSTSATQDEIKEIETLLDRGVIF